MSCLKLKLERMLFRTRQASALLVAFMLAVAVVVGAYCNTPLRDGDGKTAATQEQGLPRIRVDVSLVLLDATVKDKAGRMMKDLKREDFVLDEDGVAQEIAHFSRDQLPLAVALVVDLSESIKPFIRPLRYATLTALRSLKPEDEVALFTFSHDVQQRVPLTRDKREVSDQIEFFTTGGSTNINDAIHQAAHYLRDAAPAARRVIVLVSDNVPTDAGSVPPKAVTEAALEADAAVYGLKVPGYNPPEVRMRTKLTGAAMVNVGKLTVETGGEIFDIEKEGSLFLAFQSLIERLKTRYTLGFYPTHKAEDGSFRQLNLRLGPAFGVKGKDYSVLSKRGYYAARRRVAAR